MRQVGSCRVTNSILQYNQAAFIRNYTTSPDYFKGQGKPILLVSPVKTGDYFKEQGKPTLLESTVKTGANQIGAPSVC